MVSIFKLLSTINKFRYNKTETFIGIFLRFATLQVLVLLSYLIITAFIFSVIGILSLVDNNVLTISGPLYILNFLILNYPTSAVIFSIVLFFYVEYWLYKKVFSWLKFDKFLQNYLGGEIEYKYVNKFLLADFTVFIAFLGFVPFLIDSLFSETYFAVEVKNLVFGYFTFGLVPFVHLIYRQIK